MKEDDAVVGVMSIVRMLSRKRKQQEQQTDTGKESGAQSHKRPDRCLFSLFRFTHHLDNLVLPCRFCNKKNRIYERGGGVVEWMELMGRLE